MCSNFYQVINDASATYISDALLDFENTFAPVPPEEDDEWKLILTNLVGLGLTAIAAPFFDGGESQPLLSLEMRFLFNHHIRNC